MRCYLCTRKVVGHCRFCKGGICKRHMATDYCSYDRFLRDDGRSSWCYETKEGPCCTECHKGHKERIWENEMEDERIREALEPPSPKCFIATAAYGTFLADEVVVLRQFRDEHLTRCRMGKALVAVYYRVSPPLARVISRNPVLAAAIRFLVNPLVRLLRK